MPPEDPTPAEGPGSALRAAAATEGFRAGVTGLELPLKTVRASAVVRGVGMHEVNGKQEVGGGHGVGRGSARAPSPRALPCLLPL